MKSTPTFLFHELDDQGSTAAMEVDDGDPLDLMSDVLTDSATMIPISWTEMQCPLTNQIEQRKVAKVV